MESEQISGVELEDMIIAVGSLLYNSQCSICDIDSQFLEDLKVLLIAELEKREARLH